MDEQNKFGNRLALIGLTVLVVATLLVFAFLFLDVGSLFSDSDGDKGASSVSSDSSSDSSEQVAQEIRELQTQMNRYQLQLDSSYLKLVTADLPLSGDYDVEVASLIGDNAKYRLETAAASAMNQFLTAAEAAGHSVTIDAAYRTADEQSAAYDKAKRGYMEAGYQQSVAENMAAASVGKVNCSEHQLGLAVDFKIKDPDAKGNDGKTFEEFLVENIHKYGFILSYPTGEEDVTGHEADATHYRYVGVDVATEMVNKGFVLAEYRDYLSSRIDQCKEKIAAKEKK